MTDHKRPVGCPSDNQAAAGRLYLAAPASKRDAFKSGNVLPVAPFGLGHFPRPALVSSPRYPDHSKQVSSLLLGKSQALSGGCDFFGGRHGEIIRRIRWKHKQLDRPVSNGYYALVG